MSDRTEDLNLLYALNDFLISYTTVVPLQKIWFSFGAPSRINLHINQQELLNVLNSLVHNNTPHVLCEGKCVDM